jgi:hypothetical protein
MSLRDEIHRIVAEAGLIEGPSLIGRYKDAPGVTDGSERPSHVYATVSWLADAGDVTKERVGGRLRITHRLPCGYAQDG